MTARIGMMRGILGWGNRKGGLEAYGPGGRWGGSEHGDLLGDALERVAGQTEGATLLVISVPRFGDVTILDRIEEFVRSQT